MPTTWYEGTITQIDTIAPNVRKFILRMPEGQKLEYKAGQFITIDLPIGDRRSQRWRSYSIAEAPVPGGNEELELCIVRSEDGPGTEFLFEAIDVGSTLKFKGPEGAFCLPEHVEKDLVMICTGTGVAPFRSMIRDLKNRKIPHRKIHLIFGTRFEEGILYREEWEELARSDSQFEFDVALSRQTDWGGHKGYVHPIYSEHYSENRDDLKFMICGWTSMIDEAVENLLVKLGYDRTQIHYELYG